MAQGLPGSEKRAENQIGSKQDILKPPAKQQTHTTRKKKLIC